MKAVLHEGVGALGELHTQWRALESRALEPNAYLSARFALPALRHLRTAEPVWAVSVHDSAGVGSALRGLGLFQPRGPRPLFPLPHAQLYTSPHTYLGGVLLDAQAARPALQTMLDALARQTHGLRVENLSANGATAQMLQAVTAERGHTWHEEDCFERACIAHPATGPGRWREHLSASRLKSMERQCRKLSAHGQASWHYLRGAEVMDGTIERFIELEHAGWKGVRGTSLRSDPRQSRFFLEMTRAFRADGDLFFTELRLGSEVIASSCNLKSGRDGFAFKVCFDHRYAKYSPGVLNELGFLKALEQELDDFRFIDSGSEPGSFIEQLWPDRRALRSGTIALGPVARAAAQAAQALWRARRWLAARPGRGQPGKTANVS